MTGFYREMYPSQRLVEYVECYWVREDQLDEPNHWVLPDGCVDVLFSTKRREQCSLSVVGLMTTPLRIEIAAGTNFFGVRFRPAAASAFIAEASRMNDRVEPLENFWGSTARSICERLADTSAPKEMVAIMEGILRPTHSVNLTNQALQRLSDTDLSLARLASEAGVSERHFRRACVDRTGVPPMYLRRILRFRKTADRIRSTKGRAAQPNWAQFAVACGYYDQAHLIREFREFAGCTPGRFVQSLSGDDGLESNYNEPTESREPNRLH